MGGFYGLAILVGVALLLTPGRCQVNCGGGHPGEKGIPGRNGWPGPKGEKGEPAALPSGPVDQNILLRLKGEMGNRGEQGAMGPKGFRGDLGPAGRKGEPGPPGPGGRASDGASSSQQVRSVFSVMRTDSSYPAFDQVVTYQVTVVNQPANRPDFNAATGIFTCRTPGVYYFTFNSMSRASVCLGLVSDPPFTMLGFCDFNKNFDQVLSGGAVLELTAGQRVWLKSFKDATERKPTPTDARDTNEKRIIFSGFLLFPNQA